MSTDGSIYVPSLTVDVGADSDVLHPQPVPIETTPTAGTWFPGPESAVIHWPQFEALLIEELD